MYWSVYPADYPQSNGGSTNKKNLADKHLDWMKNTRKDYCFFTCKSRFTSNACRLSLHVTNCCIINYELWPNHMSLSSIKSLWAGLNRMMKVVLLWSASVGVVRKRAGCLSKIIKGPSLSLHQTLPLFHKTNGYGLVTWFSRMSMWAAFIMRFFPPMRLGVLLNCFYNAVSRHKLQRALLVIV